MSFLTHPRTFLLACITVVVVVAPAQAQVRRLNLADPVVSERPVPAGAQVTLELTNIVPRMRSQYVVAVRQEAIPIDTLPYPFGTAGAKNLMEGRVLWEDSDPCEVPLEAAGVLLDTATTEESVRRIVAKAQGDVEPECAADLNRFIRELTVVAVEETFIVRGNQRLVVDVSRPGEKQRAEWRYVFQTEPRGEWRAGYGFTFVPRVYPQYYTEQMEEDPTKFVVTREGGSRRSDVMTNYDFIPSILFSWMPTAARYRNWSGGATAGLGYDLDEVALFGGLSATYNENVTFSAGLAIHEQPRLGPQFTVGEVLKEDLDADALHVNRFGPNAFFGISFRFGQNPFRGRGGDDDDGEAEGSGSAPAPGSEAPANPTPVGGDGGASNLVINSAIKKGDKLGSFVVESVEGVEGEGAKAAEFKTADGTQVQISGTYTLRDGDPCITLAADATPVIPYVGTKPGIVCLALRVGQAAALQEVREGAALTVKVSQLRIEWEGDGQTVEYLALVDEVVRAPARP